MLRWCFVLLLLSPAAGCVVLLIPVQHVLAALHRSDWAVAVWAKQSERYCHPHVLTTSCDAGCCDKTPVLVQEPPVCCRLKVLAHVIS